MLRGLWQLTWLEIKIFLREPLGVIGTLGMPVLLFVLFGRLGRGRTGGRAANLPAFMAQDLAVFATTFVALGAVTSLVAIIAIYREGGILRRSRSRSWRWPAGASCPRMRRRRGCRSRSRCSFPRRASCRSAS
jgi:ABC-2 type transport system permease protein